MADTEIQKIIKKNKHVKCVHLGNLRYLHVMCVYVYMCSVYILYVCMYVYTNFPILQWILERNYHERRETVVFRDNFHVIM